MVKLEYSSYNAIKNMNGFSTVLKVVICFIILTELTRFSTLCFVLWSFQVLGKDLMDYGISSGKSLCLGMPKAPQGKIQGQPKA